MKLLFLLLFFLSTLSWAETTYPLGMFKIDPGYSRIVLSDKVQEVRGHVELLADLAGAKFILQTETASFISTSLRGDQHELVLEGILTYQGKDTPVSLKGRFLGKILSPNGEVKAAFRFSNELMSIRIFATRPTNKTKAIYRIVDHSMSSY